MGMVMRMGMILVFVPYALALAMPTDASFSPACDVSGTYSCAASNGVPGPEEGGPYVVREQQSILEIENQTSYTFVQRLIPGSGWEETEDILSVCAFNLWSEPVNPTAICADVTSEAITEYTFSDDCSTLHGVTFRSLGSAPSAVGSNTPFAGSTVCHRTDAGAVEGLAPVEEAPLEFCDVDGVWDCKVKLRFGLGQGAVTDEFTLYNTQAIRFQTTMGFEKYTVQQENQTNAIAAIFNDAAYDNVTLMDPRICAFDRLSDPNAPVALCADTTDASNHELHFESGCNVFTYIARESLVDSLPTYEDYFFGRPLAATAECVRIEGDQPVISTSDGYHLNDDAFTSLNAYEGPRCDISGDYECVTNAIFANDDGIPQPELRGRMLMRNEDVERYTYLLLVADRSADIGDEYLDTFFAYVNTTDPKICAFELWTSGEGYGVSCGELLDASMFKFRFSEDCMEMTWTGAEAVHGDDGGYFGVAVAGSASCLRVSGD